MNRPEAFNYARIASQAAEDKQAQDIKALDIREHSSLADCFLFVSGTSHVHIRAIEDAVRDALRDAGATLIRTDGQRGHLWRALDYGSLIVHIMDPKTREFYGIERLWEGGKRLDVSKKRKSKSVQDRKKPAKRPAGKPVRRKKSK